MEVFWLQIEFIAYHDQTDENGAQPNYFLIGLYNINAIDTHITHTVINRFQRFLWIDVAASHLSIIVNLKNKKMFRLQSL